MANPDRQSPQGPFRDTSTYLFDKNFPIYDRLEDAQLSGPVTQQLLPKYVKQMPANTEAHLMVDVNNVWHDVTLKKDSNSTFESGVSFTPTCAPEAFKMEALVYRPGMYEQHLPNNPLVEIIKKDPGRVMVLDLKTNRDGQHFPPFRAAAFIPWAIALYDPKYIEGFWLPSSDNHAAFFDAKRKGKTDLEAVQETWSGVQFAKAGFYQVEDLASGPVPNALPSPKGYPQIVVAALFKKQ